MESVPRPLGKRRGAKDKHAPPCRDAFLRLSKPPGLRNCQFHSAISRAETQTRVSITFRRTHGYAPHIPNDGRRGAPRLYGFFRRWTCGGQRSAATSPLAGIMESVPRPIGKRRGAKDKHAPPCRDAFLRLSKPPGLRNCQFHSAISRAETQECVSTTFRRTHGYAPHIPNDGRRGAPRLYGFFRRWTCGGQRSAAAAAHSWMAARLAPFSSLPSRQSSSG